MVTISILFIVIFCSTPSTKSRIISYKIVYKWTLDFGNLLFANNAGNSLLDVLNNQAIYSFGDNSNITLDWGSGQLYKYAGGEGEPGTLTLDWSHLILYGNWNVTGTLSINGVPISGGGGTLPSGTYITTGQTGAFASDINLISTGNILQLEINNINTWTGTSTGLFYPNSNPSGYITSGNLTGVNHAINLKTTLPSGINMTGINYNKVLTSLPSSISCTLQNDVDVFNYDFCIFSVNISGFNISFSDYLSSSGYILNSIISL